MTTNDLHQSLPALLRELTYGAAPTGGYILNSGDSGMLAALDRLSADDASSASHGGATIAAHVDHVTYGLSLMNRWIHGESPFDSADWSASWRIGRVSDAEWEHLRASLRHQADTWLTALAQPKALAGIELNGVIASIAHLAYHLGAIRQIHAGLRGPKDTGS